MWLVSYATNFVTEQFGAGRYREPGRRPAALCRATLRPGHDAISRKPGTSVTV